MDWFESLMGFVETEYALTQRQLSVDGEFLQSTVNGRRFRCGALELVSLAALRERAATAPVGPPTRVQIVQGEARALHRDPRNARALFQVASQFNLLEMIGPARRPEDGVAVTRSTGRRARLVRSPPARPRSTAIISCRSTGTGADGNAATEWPCGRGCLPQSDAEPTRGLPLADAEWLCARDGRRLRRDRRLAPLDVTG